MREDFGALVFPWPILDGAVQTPSDKREVAEGLNGVVPTLACRYFWFAQVAKPRVLHALRPVRKRPMSNPALRQDVLHRDWGCDGYAFSFRCPVGLAEAAQNVSDAEII